MQAPRAWPMPLCGHGRLTYLIPTACLARWQSAIARATALVTRRARQRLIGVKRHLLRPLNSFRLPRRDAQSCLPSRTNGRELRFELLPLGVGGACGDDGEACGRLPAATRPHAPKCMGRPPAGPIDDQAIGWDGACRGRRRDGGGLPLLWEKQTAFHFLSGRSRIVEAFRGRRARVQRPIPA